MQIQISPHKRQQFMRPYWLLNFIFLVLLPLLGLVLVALSQRYSGLFWLKYVGGLFLIQAVFTVFLFPLLLVRRLALCRPQAQEIFVYQDQMVYRTLRHGEPYLVTIKNAQLCQVGKYFLTLTGEFMEQELEQTRNRAYLIPRLKIPRLWAAEDEALILGFCARRENS